MLRRLYDRARVAIAAALPEFRFTNHTKADKKGKFPLAGQIRLTTKDGRTCARLAWDIWSRFAHVGAKVEPMEGEVVLSAAFPPVALWFGVRNYRMVDRLMGDRDAREIRFAAHDGSVWWSLWTNPDKWSSRTPRWRQGAFSVLDAILGPQEMKREPVGDPEVVTIPMPEGNYLGRSTIERCTWKRPRWFAERWSSAKVTMDPREDASFKPIPIPGKGENSYDIDDDALYTMSTKARSHGEAVAKVVENVLTTRERRGGLNWRPEPKKGEEGGSAPSTIGGRPFRLLSIDDVIDGFTPGKIFPN
jgi:hypothetical protein